MASVCLCSCECKRYSHIQMIFRTPITWWRSVYCTLIEIISCGNGNARNAQLSSQSHAKNLCYTCAGLFSHSSIFSWNVFFFLHLLLHSVPPFERVIKCELNPVWAPIKWLIAGARIRDCCNQRNKSNLRGGRFARINFNDRCINVIYVIANQFLWWIHFPIAVFFVFSRFHTFYD